MNKDISIYIHIPFCEQLCHYCDFAKTANWDAEHVKTYFETIENHALYWRDYIKSQNLMVKSIFFGGGTPGLFSGEYENIMEIFRGFLSGDSEVSLEANPSNISTRNLQKWRELGFNRLSIGVQTLEDKLLEFLKRDHNSDQTIQAILLAREYFENLNADLIYGIPRQTFESFSRDIESILNADVNHLSLYNLTFEQGTPIGRSFIRGKIKEETILNEQGFYNIARNRLAKAGYFHEEVSNWSKPGYSCVHNWVYWTAKPYIAIGAGSHGFLKKDTSLSELGVRYFYAKNDRKFSKHSNIKYSCPRSHDEFLRETDASVDIRQSNDLLLEIIATSLRTSVGVPIEQIKKDFDLSFKPTAALQDAILSKDVLYSSNLIFDESLWFFENRWILEVMDSFS